MNRPELIRELERLGVVVHPSWTVPELRATVVEQRNAIKPPKEQDKLKGLSGMSLEQLTAKALEEGLAMPSKPTRGLLMRMLRGSLQQGSDNVMTFGKFKGWLYKDVPKEYMKWAMDETAANENASMDLIRFATWAKEEFKGRENVVLTLRPPKAQEDPEMRAKIAPPDLDVMTWESAGSSDSNRSRRQPSGYRKRAAVDKRVGCNGQRDVGGVEAGDQGDGDQASHPSSEGTGRSHCSQRGPMQQLVEAMKNKWRAGLLSGGHRGVDAPSGLGDGPAGSSPTRDETPADVWMASAGTLLGRMRRLLAVFER
jgi:uncharacterized protein (DUF3820 family)